MCNVIIPEKLSLIRLAALSIAIFCICSTSFSQTWRKNADSLLLLYSQTKNPEKQVEILSKVSLILLFQKPDSALLLSNKAVGIAEAGNNILPVLFKGYTVANTTGVTLEYQRVGTK